MSHRNSNRREGGISGKAVLVLLSCLTICVGLFVWLAWDDIMAARQNTAASPVADHSLALADLPIGDQNHGNL